MSDVKLKSTTTDMAAVIKPGITVEAGVAKINSEVYEQTLAGAGLDLDTVKKVQTHNSQFTSAASLAFGEASIEHLVANPTLESVSGSVQMGHDKALFSFDRSKEVSSGPGTDRVATQGYLNKTKLVVQGGAEHKRIRGHLHDVFTEALTAK